MYASPTLVKYDYFLDLLFKMLENHPQDKVYTVVLGKDVIPQGMSRDEVYRKYGPCGCNPNYYIRVFDDQKNPVEFQEPYNYITLSAESLKKLQENFNVVKVEIDGFGGYSIPFDPSTHKKSELYNQIVPVQQENEFVKWSELPDLCKDREGKRVYREDCY